MREYWQGGFLPAPPWSDPGWFVKALNENIGIQFGIPYAVYLVFFLMLVGWVTLSLRGVASRATTWQSPVHPANSELPVGVGNDSETTTSDQDYAIAIAAIAFVTLIASALQLYPVFERMILFFVPIGLLLIGKAFDAIYARLQRYELPGVLAVLLAGYLLYGPFVTSLQNFLAPKYFEHIRPTIETLHESWKDGDALYVSNGALPAFRFYAPFYGLETIPYEFGEREDYKNPQNILSQLDSFQGQPRVWILLSHVYQRGEFNERDFILNYLNEKGEKKREFRLPGTSVFLYLYDLGK
jgi:hypothetical protein